MRGQGLSHRLPVPTPLLREGHQEEGFLSCSHSPAQSPWPWAPPLPHSALALSLVQVGKAN